MTSPVITPPPGSDPIYPSVIPNLPPGAPGTTTTTTTTLIPPNPYVTSVGSPIGPAARETLDLAEDTFERQLNVAALAEACRVTYGVDRLGAQLAIAFPYTGSSLLVVAIWGRGPIQGIASLTIGDKTPPATVVATHYLGTTSQSVDSKLVTALAALGITHTDAFAGLAYSVLEFQIGADVGDIAAVITGRLVYDPRDGTQTLGTPSTYKYSDNPALALADLITNTTYGWGQSIDWTSVTAAANACDALVSGEKKRLIGYTLSSRNSAQAWVDILRAHAGCYVVRSGAQFKLVPDAAASSVYTFTKAKLVPPITWAMRPVEQRPNVVEISYTDISATPWQKRTAVYPTNGLPPGGQELRFSRREMSGVQRYSQALREAIELINHCELEALTQGWQSWLESTPYEVGDVVTINDGGLSAGIAFRILTREWVRKGLWKFTGQKYDPAAFDSSAVAAPTTSNTTLPSPNSPPAVTGLTLTEVVEAPGPGGMPSSSISCACTAVSWPFLTGYVWYAYADDGTLLDQATTVGPAWRTRALSAPRVCTVYVKARSSVAIATGYGSASITLSGATQSLTLLTSTRVFSAGSSLLNYEAYTLYPGDPYFRVAPIPGINLTFAQQFATDTISAATGSVLAHNRSIASQYRTGNYAKTAAIDLGARKAFTVAVTGGPAANDTDRLIGFEAADSLGGPWTFGKGTVCTLTGRYVRMVVAPRDDPPTYTFPDGGTVLGPAPWVYTFGQADFGASTISVYGQTVEETDTATTSASGPVTVTLANKYAALRDLQVTAVQSGGTAVVTGDAISLSTTLANTFQINATVSGARVAVPVRWSFKGAL